ncbi:hypothetical protein ACV334_35040, partial [Pseudomonas aeruginosa]
MANIAARYAPYGGAASRFARRASEVEESAWDLADSAHRYFSSSGNTGVQAKGREIFFDAAVTKPGVPRPLERGRHTDARYQLQELPMEKISLA